MHVRARKSGTGVPAATGHSALSGRARSIVLWFIILRPSSVWSTALWSAAALTGQAERPRRPETTAVIPSTASYCRSGKFASVHAGRRANVPRQLLALPYRRGGHGDPFSRCGPALPILRLGWRGRPLAPGQS